MKRAVITGMGLVSPLGNNAVETKKSLFHTKSGIKYQTRNDKCKVARTRVRQRIN